MHASVDIEMPSRLNFEYNTIIPPNTPTLKEKPAKLEKLGKPEARLLSLFGQNRHLQAINS